MKLPWPRLKSQTPSPDNNSSRTAKLRLDTIITHDRNQISNLKPDDLIHKIETTIADHLQISKDDIATTITTDSETRTNITFAIAAVRKYPAPACKPPPHTHKPTAPPLKSKQKNNKTKAKSK